MSSCVLDYCIYVDCSYVVLHLYVQVTYYKNVCFNCSTTQQERVSWFTDSFLKLKFTNNIILTEELVICMKNVENVNVMRPPPPTKNGCPYGGHTRVLMEDTWLLMEDTRVTLWRTNESIQIQMTLKNIDRLVFGEEKTGMMTPYLEEFWR